MERKWPGVGQAERHREEEAVCFMNTVWTQQSAGCRGGTRVTGKGVRRDKGQQQGNTDGSGQGQRVNS